MLAKKMAEPNPICLVANFQPKELKIVKIPTVAFEIVNELQIVAEDFKSDEDVLKQRMSAVKYAILAEHEGFIDAFVECGGIAKMVTILRHPNNQLVMVALDVIPKLLAFDSAL